MSDLPINQYRIFCLTDGWVYSWGTVEPTTCNINTSHTINPNSLQVIDTIQKNTVKIETQNTKVQGYFSSSTVSCSIPSGTGSVLQNQVMHFPINLTGLSFEVNSDCDGDMISIEMNPGTVVGQLSQDLLLGSTLWHVDSTETLKLGFLLIIGTDYNGMCSGVDDINLTIESSDPAINNYTAGTIVTTCYPIVAGYMLTEGERKNVNSGTFNNFYFKKGDVLGLRYISLNGKNVDKKFKISYDYIF